MDSKVLEQFRNKTKTEQRKKGRRSILDATPTTPRRNYSSRQSFDIIRQKCPECSHDKAFDKTLQDVVRGIYCTRCGYKHKGREE